MGDFRARDADRERAVGTIEAAYADRQIGDADRDLRISRTQTAETLDELDALTRDLRVRATSPRQVARRPVASRPVARRPVASRPVARPNRLGALVVGLVAVGVLGAVPFVFLASGSSDLSSSTSVDGSLEAPAVSEVAVPFEMTPAQVRGFVRSVRRELGSTQVYGVTFYPSRVVVDVPVTRSGRPRTSSWRFDGAWHEAGAVTAVPATTRVLDLRVLDVRRLFDNIATARKVLRVPEGELTHVVVRHREGEGPRANIYVGSSFGESGYLATSVAGQEIRRYPSSG